jgi:hypothetical protein
MQVWGSRSRCCSRSSSARPATAALVSLGLWLFLTLIWPASGASDRDRVRASSDEETLILAAQYLARLSPSNLFGEVVLAILNPTTRSLGPIYLSQLQGAVLGAPMPLGESLIIAWPQIVGLIAGTILLFVTGYVIFQRRKCARKHRRGRLIVCREQAARPFPAFLFDLVDLTTAQIGGVAQRNTAVA